MSSIHKGKSKSRRKSRKKSKSRRKSRRKSKVKKILKKNKRPFNKGKWYIVTKEGCKYCDKSKTLLKDKNIEAEIEIINDDNRMVIYEELDNITGKYRYFPMIFYNGKFIGGYTELEKHNF